MYVLIAYDEDWYTFESFMGVFSSREKAQEIADNDYDIYGDEKVYNHAEYQIYEITIDEPFSETFSFEEESELDT